ncbi:MAG: leucine-rich repeat domain-containing protein, partial [Clostridia bacterium]
KNLKTVNYTGGESQLEVIGVNAFGITFDEYNNEKDSCESLSKMTLPDSIYEIGGYAFYKCINLSLNDIPSGLTVIKNYAFAYTKINNIDFTNVSEIGEYAFSHCSYLSIVSNTTKVTKCKKLAFEGTKLWQNQRTECLQNCDQDVKKAVFYAGTIVIGTHENYGNMFGDGTLQLSESATIIADEAFKGTKLTELYIYLTSNISREVIEGNKYEFIGDDVFYDTLGAHIIVPQDLETTYKAKYPVLSPHIGYVITETISVGVNKGTHTVWISHNASNKVAHYINYEGTGISIDLGSLASNLTFSYWERISLGAFSSNDTVTNINLGKVNYIASFAINASMTKLVTIYLTNCTSPPIMESDFSIQFEDSSSKIYVKQEDLSAYRRKWSDHATMLTYLNGVD